MSLYYCLYWCDVPRSGPVKLRIFLFCISYLSLTHSLTQTRTILGFTVLSVFISLGALIVTNVEL